MPHSTNSVFSEGDEVVLAEGTYTGTPGIFLRSTADAKWVEIRERNGTVRNHPLEWLAHAGSEPQNNAGSTPNLAVERSRRV